MVAPPVITATRERSARLRLTVRGRVQGVGFRPALYRLARERELAGTIANTDEGVVADLEGGADELQALAQNLPQLVPAQAEIDVLLLEWLPPKGHVGLQIVASGDAGGRGARVPADIATCEACLVELRDPADRRHRYPFTNCTACGPRFTIIESTPYDRPRTTMRPFPLCPACAAEYGDPLDRRYHAEPIACPGCGPTLRLVARGEDSAAAAPLGEEALAGAVARLRAGGIVAVKGLGGFHLACDARSERAVEELRRRKGRELKPFAVMVRDLGEARLHGEIGGPEAGLLASPAAPIVIVRRRAGSELAGAVAPGNSFVGLMLPYTPLHHLLLGELTALVMTSGNLAEEPIATENGEARQRLAPLADAFLEHDRDILVACDDSVLAATRRGPLFLRRSRGYVPDPVRLVAEAGQILATGGQLKNTFCLTLGRDAYLGPHVGDLEQLRSLEHFERAIERVKALLRLEPTAVAHDMHPDYATTRYAQALGLPALAVQHHHAHVAATAADHGLEGPLLGLALDGTGFGADATIWGGELLFLPDIGRYERIGHLRRFPLPGGDAAIRRPRRTALALVRELLGAGAGEAAATLAGASEEEAAAVAAMLASGVGVVATSSCGRLFDAVAALCGLGRRVTYEGQPALELEQLAEPAAVLAGEGALVRASGCCPFEVAETGAEGSLLLIDPAPALRAILDALAAGQPRPEVAAWFHAGLAAALARACGRAAALTGARRVVLGGGCFQNRLLGRLLLPLLERERLEPFLPRRVPVNDGGLALGQVAVHAALMAG